MTNKKNTTRNEDEPISFVVPAFDLFGFNNDMLSHVLGNIGKQNIILLSNDEEVDRLCMDIIRKIEVPVFNGDYLNKYINHLIEIKRLKGTIVFLLPFFPFRSQMHIDEALDAFKKTNSSFLISMDASGNDAEVIYITKVSNFIKSNNLFINPSNAFIYMVDNVLGSKIMDPEKYREALKTGVKKIDYSTEKQTELASKYRDNLREYDLEFLDNKEITDPVVLRSSKDAPQRISKLVQLKKGKRILDIGCSSGNVTLRYARNTNQEVSIIGIDIDRELIETAHMYLEKEPQEIRQKVKFICTSIDDFKDQLKESFDTIIATEFFEHVLHTQHDIMLRHCLKFLKANGNFIISVPNRFVKDIYHLQKRYRWDWYNHYTHFTKKSLEFFLSKYFNKIKFYPVYDEKPEEGIFLIAEGVGKK